MAGERAHAAAVVAALDTPLGQWSAYETDDIPRELPTIYVEVTVSRRFGGGTWMCGGRPGRGWRIVTRAVGRTENEARWAREKVAAALEDQQLVVDGRLTSRVRFEVEDDIEADDGLYSGATTWTYAEL